MISWILVSNFIILFIFILETRIYWLTWSTSGWLKPNIIEGSSLGSLGNHSFTSGYVLFYGTFIRSDLFLIIGELTSFSISYFHLFIIGLLLVLYGKKELNNYST